MVEELPEERGIKVCYREIGRRASQPDYGKAQEQAEGIAVCGYGVRACSPLAN